MISKTKKCPRCGFEKVTIINLSSSKIDFKSILWNIFMMLITAGLWMIWIVINKTKERICSDKYATCQRCGYNWIIFNVNITYLSNKLDTYINSINNKFFKKGQSMRADTVQSECKKEKSNECTKKEYRGLSRERLYELSHLTIEELENGIFTYEEKFYIQNQRLPYQEISKDKQKEIDDDIKKHVKFWK